MKKILTSGIIAVAAFSATASAAELTSIPEGAVSGVSVDRAGGTLVVRMTVHPDAFPKKSNREVWLRPAIEGAGHTLALDSVLVAGRTRYYQRLRGNAGGAPAALLRSGSRDTYEYTVSVPYERWMEYSQLDISGRVVGCAGCTRADSITTLYGGPLLTMDYRDKTLTPIMVYVAPPAEKDGKVRDVSKDAYIDFPVGKTEIYPDYRRNPQELDDIRRTIDEIQSDDDITITSVDFTGYASPEGPYALNEKLARGRTESLMDYVYRLFDFPRTTLHYSWVAEDWEGLRKKVEAMDGLSNKEALLALIADDSIAPDEKDQRLKKEFPDDYFILLSKVYPSLRHTSYSVSYRIRSFTDVEQIKALIGTAPQKLSLDEIYLYAGTLDHGSREFQDVMDIAVRMYPDDPVANLNAAATAAEKGDLKKAEAYLRKAPSGPEATYTRAVMKIKEGDIAGAKPLLQQAARAGIKEARALQDQIASFGL
ncbi:MAG: hypothetical protein K2L00_05670 [Muribaculaceae bacterium]|nr:hypothetical protein [Muribaculaceae bacterium]